ncbi:MAG: SseB family protein [Pseudobutyrivibrio sp.]|nr:SseB family protein [Pseudobutyrivibrio sp.]
MGLFNKKKPDEDQEIMEQIKAPESESFENKEEEDAGFSMVVENASSMLDGTGVIVAGELYGTVNKGDTLYIYVPAVAPIETKVVAIETKQEERMVIAESATDSFTNLQLDLADKSVIKKYSVLHSQFLPEKFTAGMKIINPPLDGIIYGMGKFSKDNQFHATLSYWLSHALLLTPVQPEVTDDEAKRKLGFYMLKSQVRLAGTPEGKDSLVLPVFTDGPSLKKWTGIAKDNEHLPTQVLRFPEMLSLIKGSNTYAGIAINPFNKKPCTLPMPYLDTITGTKGYQRDFGNPEIIHEETLKAGSKFLLGIPKETEETREVRDLLAAYGDDEDDIQSINFMVKIEEETKNVRYLIVLGTDGDRAKAKVHMEAITKQLSPLVKEVRQIEFALRGEIPQVDQIAEKHQEQMLVYKAD